MFYALLSDGDAEIRKTMIANLDDCVVNFLSALAETDQDARSKTSGADDESDSARSEFLQELLEQLVKLGESIAVQDPSLAKPKTAGIRSQLPAGASWWRLRVVFYEKVCNLFDTFPQESLKQAFYEAARFDFLNGALPLRKQWVILIAKI